MLQEVNWQEVIVFGIVFYVFLRVFLKIFRPLVVSPLAGFLLRKGRVKWAMFLKKWVGTA